MSAVLFGSIGALADTSELQREAFNESFRAHALDWNWSRDEYRELLRESGGTSRIAAYAESRGDEVNAAAVHATKSEVFRKNLQMGGIEARPGVVETIEQAQRDGVQVALVTTTSGENIAALAHALRPRIDVDSFALVVDTSDVAQFKPAPDAYEFALKRLDEQAGSCVAVEDNLGGLEAAVAAGVPCVAFPGENNVGHDFGQASRRVDSLSFAELQTLMSRH
ncbi:MAG: HAD-IA family hydrolase [Solirubrobacteraceae bacterium]